MTTKIVNDIQIGLSSLTLLETHEYPSQPAWIGKPPRDWAADDILATRNQLIHLPSLVEGQNYSIKPRPSFFNANSLSYDYEPDAPEPAEWMKFLRSLWPDDPESIHSLQEWFGYLITPDRSRQKIAMIIGPTRCGKGTIGKVIQAMLGSMNVATPKMHQLGTEFGTANLIGKSAIIVTDASVSAKSNPDAIAETLLMISGNDTVQINRKNRDHWEGQIRAKFTILGNAPPKLPDQNGALAGRMIVYKITPSFLGREDDELLPRLLRELPGILRWAIEGWRRLKDRGRFIQPASAGSVIEFMDEATNHVKGFVRESCELGAACQATKPDLYQAYRDWCNATGRQHPSQEIGFFKNLYAAQPDIRETHPTGGDGHRFRLLNGIGIRAQNPAFVGLPPLAIWLSGYLSQPGDPTTTETMVAAAGAGFNDPEEVRQMAEMIGAFEYSSEDETRYVINKPDPNPPF